MALWSCKNDDDDEATALVLQSLSETAIENDAEIQTFLQTHFYTLENSQVVIDTIAGDNLDKVALSEQILFDTVTLSPSDLGLEEDNDAGVNHKLYYLVIADGADNGAFATVADSTFLSYEGARLDGEIFDSRLEAPIWFDLLGNPLLGVGGVVKGFQKGLTRFKQGGNAIENGDGTYSIEDPSIGLIIMPSGLAYFAGIAPGKSYAPILFKLNVIRTVNADHDLDGIPSILEDLENDEDFFADDTDGDEFANFLDADDDGDGILTIDEIEVDADGNFVAYKDTDGDGIFDHLDNDN